MTNEAKHKEIIMQKNEFEVMVKELLPDVTAQAMEKWMQYAQELEQDGTEKARDLYDAAYVELRLIKEHQGEPTATRLFNYGEQFVFNYFELRGAAAKLTEGWTLEQIRDYSQSLQMAERALLSPDELKNLPKGDFIVMKTGTHPMRTKLQLYFKWGIKFEEPYQTPERAQREVYYAGKEELLMNIKKSLYSKPQPITTTKADGYMSSYGDK